MCVLNNFKNAIQCYDKRVRRKEAARRCHFYREKGVRTLALMKLNIGLCLAAALCLTAFSAVPSLGKERNWNVSSARDDAYSVYSFLGSGSLASDTYTGGAEKNSATGLSVPERSALNMWCVSDQSHMSLCGSSAFVQELVKKSGVNPVFHLLRGLLISRGSDENAGIETIAAEQQKFIDGAVSRPKKMEQVRAYLQDPKTGALFSDYGPGLVCKALAALSLNDRKNFSYFLEAAVQKENATALYLFGRLFARSELGFPKNDDLARRCMTESAQKGYLLAKSALNDWSAFASVPAVRQDEKKSKTLAELFPPPY